MSQYIVLKNIRIQNANAVAGFTWGFPAITHFLGFTHVLSRKLEPQYQIRLTGCGVISHTHQIHTYRHYNSFRFVQQKCPAKDSKFKSPPVIEEGKMNLTISLLIGIDDKTIFSGGEAERKQFEIDFKNICYQHKLAGGTILNIESARLYAEKEDKKSTMGKIKRELMPGFVLMDRSDYLKEHFIKLQKKNSEVELLDAWLDFFTLKQKARPKSDKITSHLQKLTKTEPDNQSYTHLVDIWQKHLKTPYEEDNIPEELKQHFELIKNDKKHQGLVMQWRNYCSPDEKTGADWEKQPKLVPGYLVPTVNGYKSISDLYEAGEVENVRDPNVPTCFVEAVHTIGEWMGVYRLTELSDCIWQYTYEEGWYLCQQREMQSQTEEDQSLRADLIDFIDNF